MCGRAANNHHGYPAKVEVELLALTDCVAACVVLGSKNYLTLKLRVFVDDITALLRRKNKVTAEMAKKVLNIMKEEVERKGLNLSVTEDGKEGKSKMIASCGFLEDELRQFSGGGKSHNGRQCGLPGRRPENEGQEVGSVRKIEKSEV